MAEPRSNNEWRIIHSTRIQCRYSLQHRRGHPDRRLLQETIQSAKPGQDHGMKLEEFRPGLAPPGFEGAPCPKPAFLVFLSQITRFQTVPHVLACRKTFFRCRKRIFRHGRAYFRYGNVIFLRRKTFFRQGKPISDTGIPFSDIGNRISDMEKLFPEIGMVESYMEKSVFRGRID